MLRLLVLLLVARAAWGATVVARFATPQAPVSGAVVARPVAGRAAPVVAPLAIPGTIRLELAQDVDWLVSVRAPGYWAGEVLAARGASTPIEITLTEEGRVRGTVAADVARVVVRFEGGQASCPVTSKQWDCALPAGTHDLRIRPDDNITEYRWDVVVPPRDAVDLGEIPVRAGASISGRVALAPGVREDMRRVVVTLAPEHPEPPATDRERERRALQVRSGSPVARGFFQFAGVPPGRYIVRATGRGTTEAAARVTVLADREAEMIEPLLLDEPKSLAITIAPSLAPDGKPWRVQLSRAGEGGSTDEVALSAASIDGAWRQEHLANGKYVVMLLDSSETRWASRQIEIAGKAESIDIPVPLVAIRGTVRAGADPLRATLWFGGEHGPSAVAIQSDERGEFSGVVTAPPPAGWPAVTVRADEPSVRRTLRDVKPRMSDGAATIDIRLPAVILRGRVRNADGTRVANALVTLHMARAETSAQLRTRDDGTFAFAGVEAGHYAIRAEASGRESDWLPLDVGSTSTSVDLTLLPKIEITGRVISDHGAIPGAQLDAFPMEHRYPSWARRSDTSGHFTIKLPHWTRSVAIAVAAPGHAFRMLAVTPDPASPLTVMVGQAGGALSFDVAKGTDLRNLWLVHNGAAMLAAFAHDIAGGTVANDGSRFTLPLVEPGEWALCIGSEARARDRCSAGTLAPGGELRLTAR